MTERTENTRAESGRDNTSREGGRRDNRERNAEPRERSEFVDKLIAVNRVSKTVKGGRKMRMAAVVVVGDENGRVGWGKGKSKEVPDAVRKATDEAKRSMVRVPLRQGRTIHHAVNGSFGASSVLLKPAVPGTGIIAGGPMRAIFEAMGIKDVVAKAMGSTNPFNLIQATFAAFAAMETPRGIAAKRGLKITDLVLHKDQSSKGEVDQKELLEKAEKAKAARQARDAKKPARAGGKGGERKEGSRGPRPERKEAPRVVTVSKSESMKQATAKSEATEAPATETNS